MILAIYITQIVSHKQEKRRHEIYVQYESVYQNVIYIVPQFNFEIKGASVQL